MMMMMGRVMCVLAVVLCCACGYTMTASAAAGSSSAFVYTSKSDYSLDWKDFLISTSNTKKCETDKLATVDGISCSLRKQPGESSSAPKEHEDTRRGASGEEARSEEVSSLQTHVQANGQSSHQHSDISRLSPATSSIPVGSDAQDDGHANVEEQNRVTPTVTSTQSQTTESTSESSTTSTASTNESAGTSATAANTADTSTPATSNATQQSPANGDASAAPDSQETTSTTLPISENTTTEAPTPTPSPVPNADINTNITSTMQNKANADSSVSPLWMRTAAPLLIVVVLFSATVY
ncbi:uncharacterized protein TM35_000641250 [Trypanosoma theileri]|uniref:Mucin TcMUCII n=1 Tax=Trypanosoma theileri TaxID=67003 RepID=A0A1X0NGL7_9TRYP|nr:uncharacterized protein TM35_000641250 [Trypanosoma theileri]ORC83593.1 hypothetical protein TM35_000641250 [Trypanosoma theileri]